MTEETPDYTDTQARERPLAFLSRRRTRFAAAVLGVAVLGGYILGAVGSGGGQSGLVAFDTAKYVNARNEAAASLIGDDGGMEAVADVSVLVTQADSTVRAKIEELAGDRIVIVKQALVIPDRVEDITDEVLEQLGLPTDVPTLSAPTPERTKLNDYEASTLYEKAERNVSEQNERAREELRAQDNILP